MLVSVVSVVATIFVVTSETTLSLNGVITDLGVSEVSQVTYRKNPAVSPGFSPMQLLFDLSAVVEGDSVGSGEQSRRPMYCDACDQFVWFQHGFKPLKHGRESS